MARLHRRNFLPTVIVNLVLWIACGLIIYFLNPDKYLNVILFFIIFTPSFALTLTLLLGNTRWGFFVSFIITGILILKVLLSRLI